MGRVVARSGQDRNDLHFGNAQAELDLQIFDARVLGGKVIADAIEDTKGAQTFVNLDDDDRDGKFDNQDSNIPGGDNELVKVRLWVKPAGNNLGFVTMTALAGGGTVNVWYRDDRFARPFDEYPLGTPLAVAGFKQQGAWRYKDLWVEGTAAHTAQQQLKLPLTYDKAPLLHDEVALTVIGIDKIEWIGRGNSANDDNVLTNDPNFLAYPFGIPLEPGAVRVFPDARRDDATGVIDNKPRDLVDVKVTLSVTPVTPVLIHFRSFDVDDPSAEAAPVDAESKRNDNRGSGGFAGVGFLYDDRQLPSGHLDAGRLAILADALEGAGCSNADILSHCRLPGPHVPAHRDGRR